MLYSMFTCFLDFTCEPGQYLDVAGDQQCMPCPAGKFSLGGGVLLEDWDHMPAGLVATAEPFSFRHYTRYSYQGGGDNDNDSDNDDDEEDTKATGNSTNGCDM